MYTCTSEKLVLKGMYMHVHVHGRTRAIPCGVEVFLDLKVELVSSDLLVETARVRHVELDTELNQHRVDTYVWGWV